MSQFNVDAYFAKRQSLAKPEKVTELLQAKEAKLTKLDAYQAKIEQENLADAARRESSPAWVDQLGLDPTGAAGTAVNAFARYTSGAGRAAGHAIAAIPGSIGLVTGSDLTDEDYQAINRFQTGQASPADVERVNSRRYMVSENDTPEAKLRAQAAQPDAPTVMELYLRAEAARNAGRQVVGMLDSSHVVDTTRTDAMNAQLRENFQGSDGMIDAAAGALDAVGGNKMAAAEYIIENIPQLAIGAMGKLGAGLLGASNAGYATDTYQKGIEKYQKENNGQMPPEEVRQRMGREAAALAAVEQAADLVGLGSIGKLGKVSTDVADAGISGVKRSVANIAKASATGVVVEGATEAYQTLLEESIQGNTASPEDLYVAGVIGSVAGGGMTTGGRALAEATKSTPEQIQEAKVKQEEQVKKAEVFRAAVENNDPSPYLDEKSKDYDRSMAVGVLLKHAQQDTAAPEVKQKNFEQASKLVEQLEVEQANLQEEAASRSPEQVQLFKDRLAETKDKLKAANPADTETVKQLKETAQVIQEEIDVLTDAKAGRTLTVQMGKLDRQVESSRKRLEEFETPTDTKATPAKTALNLSMRSTEALTATDAQKLAEDKTSKLSDTERGYLRAFSAARIAENALSSTSKVSQEVLLGSAKNVGIAQYRKRIGTALAANNQPAAQRQIGMLEKFANDHASKAVAARKAMEKGKGTQIVKTASGWAVSEQVLSKAELKKNGGLEMYSQQLADDIRSEAIALKKVAAEMKVAHAAKFGVPFSPAPSTTSGSPASLFREKREREGRVEYETEVSSLPTQKVNPDLPPSSTEDSHIGEQFTNEAVAREYIRDNKIGATHTVKAVGRNRIEIVARKEAIEQDSAAKQEAAQQQAVAPAKAPVAEAATAKAEEVKPVSQTKKAQADSIGLPLAGDSSSSTAASPASEPASLAVAGAPLATVPSLAPAAGPILTGLKVFGLYAKELPGKLQDVYRELNLVAQFLKQDQHSEKYKTKRPLVARTDFLTAWSKGEDFPDAYAEFERTEEVDSALDNLFENLVAWVGKLPEQFAVYKGHPDYQHQYMLQYLLDENVDVEENVKTAMAYSMYQWILAKANSPAFMEKDNIATMHSFDGGNYVSPEGQAMLRGVHSFEDLAIFELGDMAAQVLGLKEREDAPADILPKLKNALGTHILVLLEKEGFVKRESKNAHEVLDHFFAPGNEFDADKTKAKFHPDAKFNYVSFVREKDGVALTNAARRIRDANGGSKGVVDKVFGIEQAARIAGTKPVKLTQEFAKGTEQEISEFQKKVIQDTMDTPHKVIPEMLYLVMGMGREAFLKAAGWREIDPEKIHANNRRSVEANNLNLENQFDLAMEMMGLDPHDLMANFTPELFKTEWFVEGSIWRNFRAGFTNHSLNQQTSKQHRALFSRPEWATTIDMNDDAMVEELLVSIAMLLGVKTDQQPNADTLAPKGKWVQKLVKNPKINQAVEVVRKAILDEDISVWTDANIELVRDVAVGAEGMATLPTLIAYAKFLEAKERKDRGEADVKFDVTLLVGADGKTNGPILSILALGAANSIDEFFALLNRGGMFSTDANQATHYSEYYKGADAMDLYEDLGSEILKNVKSMIKPEKFIFGLLKNKDWSAFDYSTQEQFDAFQAVTKDLLDETNKIVSAGRNLVKTPLTSFAFGSALRSSILAMENSFIESIYLTFEGLADGSRTDITRQAFLEALNVLIKKGDYKLAPIDTNMQHAALMDYVLPREQEAAIRKAFQGIMGKQVKGTMESYFAAFIERRSALNKTIQATHATFRVAYADARQQKMEKLMDDGVMASRTSTVKGEQVRTPLHELSLKQEKELKASFLGLQPVVHTAYSVRENNLKAGLYMAKTELQMSTLPLFTSKIPVNGGVNRKGAYSNYLDSQSMTRVEVSPGVAGVPYLMHALDSANIHMAMNSVAQSLNVHDEISNGVGKVKAAANAINKATAENFLNYSPAREAMHAFERVVTNLASRVKAGTADKMTVTKVFAAWAEVYNKGLDEDLQVTPSEAMELMVKDTLKNTYNADFMRLSAFVKMASIDQYTWEGGQFEVTPEMREQAQKHLDAVIKQGMEPSKHLAESMQVLLDAHEDLLTERDSPDWIDNDNGVQEEADASPYGIIGTPAIDSDPVLVDKFSRNQSPSVKQVIDHLKQAIGNTTDAGRFSQLLLRMVERTVNPGLELRYVTPDTAPEAVLALAKGESRGWYVATEDGKEAIYLLSPHFKASGLTNEVLLHELTHAALARTIEQELAAKKANPAYRSDALDLVEELQTLLELAKDKAGELGLDSQYKEALSDVQELVAYGMSNAGFQKDVLSQVTMKVGSVDNPLVLASGMKKFIDTLVQLLFRAFNKDTRDMATTGMTALVTNVAGLFNQAAKDRPLVAVNQSMAAPNPAAPINGYTTAQVYAALNASNNGRTVSPEFDVQLRKLLDGMVAKLHGPAGTIKDDIQQGQNLTAEAMFAKAVATGKAPFASASLASGFAFTDQEAFVLEQVEATVRSAITVNDGPTSAAYRELTRLYADVAAKVQVKDLHEGNWATATPHEQAQAKALHDFIFKMQAGADNRSDYLSRFAALGLAHEGFNKLLQNTATQQQAKAAPTSFAERLNNIFEQFLDWFAGKVTATFNGQQADEKLTNLVNQLVQIEAKKKRTLELKVDYFGPMEKAATRLSDAARLKLEKFGKLPFFQNNKSGFVRAAGAITSAYAGERVEYMLEGLNKLRDQQLKSQHGPMMALINEARGAHETNMVFHMLLRLSKHIEGLRKGLITNTSKIVLGSFANGGRYLSEAHKKGISAVMLRTDMGSLLDSYGLNGLHNMLQDMDRVDDEINVLEADLLGLGGAAKFSRYYVYQSKMLGYYKATGKVTGKNMAQNAGNIARLYGTDQVKRITDKDARAAEPIIDHLVSLYAIKYSNSVDIKAAREVMDAEMARTDGGNGVEMILKSHKALQEKSKALLFNGSEALQMKGYTPEIYDPYMSVVVADATEGKLLEAQGYIKGAVVGVDKSDPDQGVMKHIYHLRDGGMKRHLTGIVGYTGREAKGAKTHNGNTTLLNVSGQINANKMAHIEAMNAAAIKAQFSTTGFDPTRVNDTHMAPVFNAHGQVVNHRYLMQESTKDVLFNRDNRPEKILGALAGSIYDKVETPVQNKKAVQALHDQYKEEFAERPESYLEVGPTSTDPQLREIWFMLPEETKRDVKAIWGREGMLVRTDLLDLNFGYRKLSIADAVDKDKAERNFMETMLVELATHAFGAKAGLRLRQGEDVWQTIVKATKSNLVVKSWSTLTGNLRSNWSELILLGVSPTSIYKHHRVALKGVWNYRKDSAELFELEHQLEAGTLKAGQNVADIKRRIVALKDAMARNPVTPLIDAGLMPTIVEDVAEDDDIYSFKSRFVKDLEGFTEKINPHVRGVGKEVLMLEGSTAYEIASYATQISDFLSRYTLYQHLTTKKDALTPQEAVQQASDAFINYDIPTHRMVQYANDSGLVMFTKYYLRIQKILVKIYREHPGRAIAMIGLENWLGAQPTVMDSSMLVRWGNPLNLGALDYPGSIDAITTVRLITSPFRGGGNPAE